MKFSVFSATALLAVPIHAFVPSSPIKSASFESASKLQMAFPTDQASNMFDGPLALTKERDACGVGFIANTQSGGKLMIDWEIVDVDIVDVDIIDVCPK